MSSQFSCGPYTVRQTLRFDNPYWPCFIVSRGNKHIGRCFSVPDKGWCQYLERALKAQQDAEAGKIKWQQWKNWSMAGRRGRPTRAEKERRDAMLLHVEELTAE
jgi:hypothetical protein